MKDTKIPARVWLRFDDAGLSWRLDLQDGHDYAEYVLANRAPESSQQRRDNIQQLFQAVGGPQGLEYLRNSDRGFYDFVLAAYNIEMLDEKSK